MVEPSFQVYAAVSKSHGLPIATLLLSPLREVLLAGGPIHDDLIVVTNEPTIVSDLVCRGVGTFASAVGPVAWDMPYGTALQGKDVVWLPVDCTAAVERQHLEQIGKRARRIKHVGHRTWSSKHYQDLIRAHGRSALHALFSEAETLDPNVEPGCFDNALRFRDGSSSPSTFNEALVIRVTTPTLRLAVSIASALGVNAAAGGILAGVRLTSRPVQIISSLAAETWAANECEARTAYGLDDDGLTSNFMVETETTGCPLGHLRHDNGAFGFDPSLLAETIRRNAAPGLLMILLESDLYRGGDRDRRLVYESMAWLRGLARQSGMTLIVLAVGSAEHRLGTIAGAPLLSSLQGQEADVQLDLLRTDDGYVLQQEEGRTADRYRSLFLRRAAPRTFLVGGPETLVPAGMLGLESEAIDAGLYSDAIDLLAVLTEVPASTRVPASAFARGGTIDVLMARPDLPARFRGPGGTRRMAQCLAYMVETGLIVFEQSSAARKGVLGVKVSAVGHEALARSEREARAPDDETAFDRAECAWIRFGEYLSRQRASWD